MPGSRRIAMWLAVTLLGGGCGDDVSMSEDAAGDALIDVRRDGLADGSQDAAPDETQDAALPDVLTADVPPGADGTIDPAPGPDLPSDGPVDSTADGNTASTCPEPCVGSNWAQWPMPNTAADVAKGAPNPAKLTDNGNGTVSDGVTGLMWQRSATVTYYTRAQARARCQALRTGGHADWRVPSAIELGSIVDYDFLNASIDAKAFPDTPIDTHSGVPLGYFGTTTVAVPPVAGWLVDFHAGAISVSMTEDDRLVYVRCVRGPLAPAADTSSGRYDLSLSGTARDIKTNLTWQRTASGSRMRLADARNLCAAGTGLPGTGWRLPTIKELMTLIDFAKPAKFRIDETVFTTPTELGDQYNVVWSATSVVGKPRDTQFMTGAWSVYFSLGHVFPIDSMGFAYARCVR